jgi:hypothetical protein
VLRDVRELLYTAAYHPAEIDRILDPENPAFIAFDPELGYELKDYVFRDGMEKTLSRYVYDPRWGYRKMINYVELPCRINTYGDSFTQCAQVSDGETWQEVLAANFREPIRNFGVGGYGVYQAYRRAMRIETTEIASEYIVLNIWDDDYMRNIDAARWTRVAWMCRDLPRGGKDTYPVHGFPWAHVRYDLSTDAFVENPGMCSSAEDLRKLVGQENYYEAFKDDTVAHLYTLREGGDAPVEELEQLAEAFGMKVDLRSPRNRADEAMRLHIAYGVRSTMFVVDKFREWANANGRKLMLLLSYDVPAVQTFIATGERFDQEFVDYLDDKRFLYVDCLKKAHEEHKAYCLPIDDFIGRFYVERAGAQVFGHYKPHGNFWFAHAIRNELLDWLDPKPPAYQ